MLKPLEITIATMPPATRPTTNTGLIAFGSNQGDSMQIFKASVDLLQRIAGVTVVTHSQPVWTEPVTGTLQNDSTQSTVQQPYLNAVIRIQTQLKPRDLHLQTSAIEHQFGRVRAGRWQARTIDLDLLILGDHIANTRSLTLPHPRMSFRRFVLEPAAEIAADLRHPTSKCSIADLLKRINSPTKLMGFVSPDSEHQAAALEKLAIVLSKKNSQWRFEKIFSAEKLFQLDSKLTMVVAFDDHQSSAENAIWWQLKEQALRFAGPMLHLKTPSNSQASVNELSAALQAIG